VWKTGPLEHNPSGNRIPKGKQLPGEGGKLEDDPGEPAKAPDDPPQEYWGQGWRIPRKETRRSKKELAWALL